MSYNIFNTLMPYKQTHSSLELAYVSWRKSILIFHNLLAFFRFRSFLHNSIRSEVCLLFLVYLFGCKTGINGHCEWRHVHENESHNTRKFDLNIFDYDNKWMDALHKADTKDEPQNNQPFSRWVVTMLCWKESHMRREREVREAKWTLSLGIWRIGCSALRASLRMNVCTRSKHCFKAPIIFRTSSLTDKNCGLMRYCFCL